MKIIRIYNILFTIFFIAVFHGFIYERYFHNEAYVKYALNYTNGFSQYSIEEPPPEHEPSIYELYEISFLYEVAHRAFRFVYNLTFFLFIPMFGLVHGGTL